MSRQRQREAAAAASSGGSRDGSGGSGSGGSGSGGKSRAAAGAAVGRELRKLERRPHFSAGAIRVGAIRFSWRYSALPGALLV